MNQKIRVGILFGGQSAEHEVSLQSAKNINEALDKDRYEITLIGIDKQGKWFLNETNNFLLNAEDPKKIKLKKSDQSVALMPGKAEEKLVYISEGNLKKSLDVIMPVLHGTYGEDGTMQGLLRLADIPFVGSDVLGSAVCMDKDVCKRLMRDAGIPNSKFLVYHKRDLPNIDYETVTKELGTPCFIKPANLGSSVGIHKSSDSTSFYEGIQDAFLYDHKILIEEFIEGREIECAILGNEKLTASIPGEVIPLHDFYSYEAKYLDDKGANLQIPAILPDEKVSEIQELAKKTFHTLCCEGLARVDVFLKKDGSLIVNEVNTLPGFTKISMYPKLMGISGVPYSQLLDKLIELALERGKRYRQLKTTCN